MFKVPCLAVCVVMALFIAVQSASGEDDAKLPIPAAILPFEARGDVKEEATQVADLLFAELIACDELMLVERESIATVFAELKLNQSGVVKADEVAQVGKLTGAKLLISGSVLQVKGDLYLVAKVIGTETSRLSGASVKGAANSDLGDLVKALAEEVKTVVAKKSDTLLPKVVAEADWLAEMKNQLRGKKLPSMTVAIGERHVGESVLDPAAQTEFERLLTELGFEVVDSENANAVRADVIIKGQALSEFATRRDDLVSVKCRVEVKAMQQADGKLLTSDAETAMSVGLAEQIAAKSGLQATARTLVGRVVTKLVTSPEAPAPQPAAPAAPSVEK